jgi:hypothetical protein
MLVYLGAFFDCGVGNEVLDLFFEPIVCVGNVTSW